MIYLLHHSVEVAANQRPNATAFTDGSRMITYQELNEKSNQLAWALMANGVALGDRVGVLTGRSIDSAIAIYGILKAGAAFVPINPFSIIGSAEEVIQQCDINCLIVNAASNRLANSLLLKDRKPAFKVIEVDVDRENSTLLDKLGPQSLITKTQLSEFDCGSNPSIRLTEMDIAYIIFTSGSTGIPKGITHTHASGLQYARLVKSSYGLSSEDCIAGHSALHFDMSTLIFLAGPFIQAKNVVVPEAHTRMPASMSKLIEDEAVTVWYSVPFALQQLSTQGALQNRDFSALRWVLYGGEPCSIEVLNTLMKIWPTAKFNNVYGPAEVNQCTTYTITPQFYKEIDSAQADGGQIPLGVAWENTEIIIVDNQDQEVVGEEIGELLIRTPTMMAGYWNRPDLNELAFSHRTLDSGLVGRYYRSGDLGYRKASKLHYIGRKDRQVKIRGYRIELLHVEKVLLSFRGVIEAVAFKHLDPEDMTVLAAAVAVNDKNKFEKQALMSHIYDNLPDYSVPSRLFILEKLPRAGGGKLDFHKLVQLT